MSGDSSASWSYITNIITRMAEFKTPIIIHDPLKAAVVDLRGRGESTLKGFFCPRVFQCQDVPLIFSISPSLASELSPLGTCAATALISATC